MVCVSCDELVTPTMAAGIDYSSSTNMIKRLKVTNHLHVLPVVYPQMWLSCVSFPNEHIVASGIVTTVGHQLLAL